MAVLLLTSTNSNVMLERLVARSLLAAMEKSVSANTIPSSPVQQSRMVVTTFTQQHHKVRVAACQSVLVLPMPHAR